MLVFSGRESVMERDMYKKLMIWAVLPALLLVQPAEARRLFWWQMVNPDGTAVSPDVYDDTVVPQNVYGPDPYGPPDDQFNQDQYQLYRREMARRYHRHAYDGPDAAPIYADPVPPPPYAAPIYPSKPKRKLVNKIIRPKPVIKRPAIAATVLPQPAPVTTASITPPTAKVAPVKKSGAVTCEKGASIVSSFGFDSVSTKSCDGATLVYNANRGGKAFEINVSQSSGELTAVKKL